MASSAADNFNRANETPLAGNWTLVTNSQATFNLTSNEILSTATGTTRGTSYRWNADTFGDNQYSQCSANTLGTDTDWSAIARVSASAYTFYMASAYAPNERLFKCVAGSFTALVSITTDNVAVGDVVRVECEGTTIRWVLNGVSKGSATDSAIASGSPGIFIWQSSARLDNWAGGDLATAHGKVNQAFLHSKLQGLVN